MVVLLLDLALKRKLLPLNKMRNLQAFKKN
jgi:hypothetical protein